MTWPLRLFMRHFRYLSHTHSLTHPTFQRSSRLLVSISKLKPMAEIKFILVPFMLWAQHIGSTLFPYYCRFHSAGSNKKRPEFSGEIGLESIKFFVVNFHWKPIMMPPEIRFEKDHLFRIYSRPENIWKSNHHSPGKKGSILLYILPQIHPKKESELLSDNTGVSWSFPPGKGLVRFDLSRSKSLFFSAIDHAVPS